MTLRPEHLEPIMRRGQNNEGMLRLLVTERLAELVDMYYESPKKADTMLEIFESIQADEGKYQFADFRAAVNEALLGDATPPEREKRRIDRYLRYLFPPPAA